MPNDEIIKYLFTYDLYDGSNDEFREDFETIPEVEYIYDDTDLPSTSLLFGSYGSDDLEGLNRAIINSMEECGHDNIVKATLVEVAKISVLYVE